MIYVIDITFRSQPVRPSMGAWLTHCGLVIQGAVGLVLYKVADILITTGKKIFYSIFCNGIEIISEGNNKCIHALKHELEILISPDKIIGVTDGVVEPHFSLTYGTYRVKTKELGHLFVEYSEKGIELYCFPEVSVCPLRYRSRQEDLKTFMTKTYKKHCAPTEMIMTYTSNKDKWSYPIIRRPTNFLDANMNTEMIATMADISKFKTKEAAYREKGVPYRRGYLLYGVPGSGKTTIIELAAKKFNMTLYSLNLNSSDMSDIVLTNLIATVPPNSIIILEEFDKQLEALSKSKNTYISFAGILSAIDGPQRLSHSTIVIMTANKKEFLTNEQADSLFRAGRIDKQIEFKNKLVVNIDRDPNEA